MSVSDEQFVSVRRLNHSPFSATWPLRELPKTGPMAAAEATLKD